MIGKTLRVLGVPAFTGLSDAELDFLLDVKMRRLHWFRDSREHPAEMYSRFSRLKWIHFDGGVAGEAAPSDGPESVIPARVSAWAFSPFVPSTILRLVSEYELRTAREGVPRLTARQKKSLARAEERRRLGMPLDLRRAIESALTTSYARSIFTHKKHPWQIVVPFQTESIPLPPGVRREWVSTGKLEAVLNDLIGGFRENEVLEAAEALHNIVWPKATLADVLDWNTACKIELLTRLRHRRQQSAISEKPSSE